MRKRRVKAAFLALAALLAFGVEMVRVRMTLPADPVVNGMSLRSLVRRIGRPSSTAPDVVDGVVQEGLRALSTNEIACLVRWAGFERAAWRAPTAAWLSWWPEIQRKVREDEQEDFSTKACLALGHIQRLAQGVGPLVAVATNAGSSPEHRGAAWQAVLTMRERAFPELSEACSALAPPNGKPLTARQGPIHRGDAIMALAEGAGLMSPGELAALAPVLAQGLSPGYPRPARERVAWVLAWHRLIPGSVVPALRRMLTEGDIEFNDNGAFWLGMYGTNAAVALPALTNLLTSPNPGVRVRARGAINDIVRELTARTTDSVGQ